MRVNVTRKDIDEGRECASTECPIALAIQRSSHNIRSALVDVAHVKVYYYNSSFGTLYHLPEEARKFIHNFDSGHLRSKLQPFSFDLEPVI